MDSSKTLFGKFGGQYIPETLFPAIQELETIYKKIKTDTAFWEEYHNLLTHYVGRPSPLYLAKTISQQKKAKIYLKREDLNHTGAHKINNTIGQALLAKRIGKKRIIAETGAGQHGVATATACALLNLDCTIYMGQKDINRQAPNVARMHLLGARVIAVKTGSQTLKDAVTESLRDWMETVETTHYIIGTVTGPHPFPLIVRDFQRIIGDETKQQIQEQEGRLPDEIVACVGGGSNAMGIFYPFLNDKAVKLTAVEAAGKGLETNEHAAVLTKGSIGILHGTKSYLLQDEKGQINPVHSISAGLDYPGVSPELSHLKDINRLSVSSSTDQEALTACKWLCETEGIIPALESSHALAYIKALNIDNPNKIIVINLSGRGDKDMETIREQLNNPI